MNNGYYYQILASLSRESGNFNYPRFLKDMVRKGDIENVQELQLFFAEELANTSLASSEGVDYFLFISEMSLLFCIYREEYQSFRDMLVIIHNRFDGIQAGKVENVNVEGWRHYFNYLEQSARRMVRHISIEAFENDIDELDWSSIGEEFIYRISGMTGFVYLKETDPSKFNKARFWLQKAISEVDIEGGLVYYLNLADFYFSDRKRDSIKRVQDQIAHLENKSNSSQDPNIKRLFHEAVIELQAKALIFKFAFYDDDQVRLEENIMSVRELQKNTDYECKNSPTFVRSFLKMAFARYYMELTTTDLDRDDIEDLLNRALSNINEAMSIAKKTQDVGLEEYNRLSWLRIVCERGTKVSEKDLKEIVNQFRNSQNYNYFVDASNYFALFYLNQKESQKAYELFSEVIKRGQKWLDQGGFFLINRGLESINKIMLKEIIKPGVSWIVAELDNYFNRIIEIIGSLDDVEKIAGTEQFDQFMNAYHAFEPVSHFNLKVYLKYQWQAIVLLEKVCIFKGEETALKIATMLKSEIEREENPLSFVTCRWEEFKDVPNSVRNKVLNKCISISKGDLPLAAEHLDFSYRNLRSYITFKEVNRLGFFLDHQDTTNRQLELGIRLLFFDLYKNGTIFEVVFDMPKFLVEFAKTGFSSLDLEEALDIKGTTAKKYIKIMMEIGLITHERSLGRKHFYKLRKDNVMNRLGKDQKVIAG